MAGTRFVIEEIAIRDLGVIADATLPLGPGFTALTGETGAGKTMVVTALGLLLGGRAERDAVRHGSAQAWVEGRWRIPASGPVADRVRDAGGDLDEIDDGPAELVLTRSVSSEGRSRAVVGGRGAPVSVLAELSDRLVAVHGQSDQLRLRTASAQREALDQFAADPLADALTAYRDVFHRWRDQRERLDTLTRERDQRAREADELRASIAEIDAAAPQPGEDTALAEQAQRLGNLESLRLAAAAAREALSAEQSEGPDATALIETARRELERAGEHDTALAPIASALADAGYAVADAAAGLSSYLAELDADGARDLEAIEGRRAELGALTRKFGPSLDDVLRLLATGGTRLTELDGDAEEIDALRARLDADAARLAEEADRVTALREDAAARMSAQTTAELAALAMPDAAIRVTLEPLPEYGEHGRDRVEILLCPHAGADARPLGKGASGGELSRIMLAIEVVLAGRDPVPTLVFDEIDAGVGGAAAIEIGRRLARLARTAQVIVVTHLAQVAAFATNHLTVVKSGDGRVTASSVARIAGDERISEMARLLSGLPDSASGLAHARELVELARADALIA